MKRSSIVFSGKTCEFNYLVLGGFIGIISVTNKLRSEPLNPNLSEVEQANALARKLLAKNELKINHEPLIN